MTAILLPLITFVIAVSFTPGPNNVMLTASGVNFGFQRSLPHICGIVVGMPVMTMAVGLGLGQIFKLYPQLYEILKWAGSAYLLFLAWKIATSSRPKDVAAKAAPLTFLQAALFQWINPKSWIAAIAALTSFTSGINNYLIDTLIVTAAFVLAGAGSTTLWTYFGTLIGQWLKSPKSLVIFNGVMAALIVASIALLYL